MADAPRSEYRPRGGTDPLAFADAAPGVSGRREVQCPRCHRAFSTRRAWVLRCPHCNLAWQPPSNRGIADWLRDRWEDALSGLLVFFLVAGIGAFAYFVLYVFANAWEAPGTEYLAAIFIACIVFMFAVSRLRH